MSKLDRALIAYDDLEDPRLLDLPRGVRLLHVEATTWAALHRTDGAISRGALRRLTDEEEPLLAAGQLVDAGMWEVTDAGWQIVGFTDSQMSAEDVGRIMEVNRLRQRRFRQHRLGDHSLCSRCPAVRNSVTNGVSNDSRLDSTPAPYGAERREAAAPAGGQKPPPAPVEVERVDVDLRQRLTFDQGTGRWVDPGSGVEPCTDYEAHRSQHRKTAAGWRCDLCHPELRAVDSVAGAA